MQRLFVFWCKFALNCGVTASDFPTNLVRSFLQMSFRRMLNLIILLILTRDVCERKARARQKRIESKLTRDLFAFWLPFLAEKHQLYASIVCRYATKKTRPCTFFFGKVCKCAFFFVTLQPKVAKTCLHGQMTYLCFLLFASSNTSNDTTWVVNRLCKSLINTACWNI